MVLCFWISPEVPIGTARPGVLVGLRDRVAQARRGLSADVPEHRQPAMAILPAGMPILANRVTVRPNCHKRQWNARF